MNDRELLELAAKAAGLVVDGTFETDTGQAWLTHWAERHGELQPLLWNPLSNDGDAFRLAVALDLDVGQAVDYREVQVGGSLPSTIFEPWADDKMAATRRAIVRGAAEMGKASV